MDREVLEARLFHLSSTTPYGFLALCKVVWGWQPVEYKLILDYVNSFDTARSRGLAQAIEAVKSLFPSVEMAGNDLEKAINRAR